MRLTFNDIQIELNIIYQSVLSPLFGGNNDIWPEKSLPSNSLSQ